MRLEHLETKPQIHESAYIAPSAVIVGDVVIGALSSVWFGCVLRGDVHRLQIGQRVNIQDGCICHGQLDEFDLQIEDEVSIGHAARLHGCRIGKRSLIGLGAILLNGCQIGSESIVAAGSVVTQGTVIPEGVLVAGAPAKIKRDINEQDRQLIDYTHEHYVAYAAAFQRAKIVGKRPAHPFGGVFA